MDSGGHTRDAGCLGSWVAEVVVARPRSLLISSFLKAKSVRELLHFTLKVLSRLQSATVVPKGDEGDCSASVSSALGGSNEQPTMSSTHGSEAGGGGGEGADVEKGVVGSRKDVGDDSTVGIAAGAVVAERAVDDAGVGLSNHSKTIKLLCSAVASALRRFGALVGTKLVGFLLRGLQTLEVLIPLPLTCYPGLLHQSFHLIPIHRCLNQCFRVGKALPFLH